jgi:hypothetical protein
MMILKTIPAWLLMAFFTLGGVINLFSLKDNAAEYARWGYPSWFHIVTGLLELATVVLLALTTTRLYGAGLGACVMLAAIGTLLLNHEAPRVVAPAVVLLVLGIVAAIAYWSKDGGLAA